MTNKTNKTNEKTMYVKPLEYCGGTIVINRFEGDKTINVAMNLELFDDMNCTYNVITLQPQGIDDMDKYEETRLELKQELLRFFDGKRPAMVADNDDVIQRAISLILGDETFAILLVQRIEEIIDYIKNEATDRDLREVDVLEAYKEAVAKKYITNPTLDVTGKVVNR